MNVIYIPVFNRPAFLHVCLEQLVKNPEYKDFLFFFHVDFGYNRKIIDVIQYFMEAHGIRAEIEYQPKHPFKKLPTNILNGYKNAVTRSDKYIIMVEPDVFVANDFIKWHMTIHAQEPQIFCSIATKNNNVDQHKELVQDVSLYYKSHLSYQSLGVCFNKKVIQKHILQHATFRYYRDLFGYCAKRFPGSKIGKVYVEQAGLIRRVQERLRNMPIVYPNIPRAFHGGFMGKNRIRPDVNFEGLDFPDRVKRVREIAFDINELRKVVKEERYVADSVPINTVSEKWDSLHLTE